MAKKAKVVQEETEAGQAEETTQEVVLTAEELAVNEALAADNHIGALTELAESELSGPILKTIIKTFIALTNALGSEAPATQHALSNLSNFKSEVVKAKKERAKKEPKFNEVAELKKVLAEETPNFESLMGDERVSDVLKTLITTYTTLSGIEGMDEAVVANAKANLAMHGGKGRKRAASTNPVEEFHVESEGVTYKNLAAALRAHGHDNDTIEKDGKQIRKIDLAWRAVRGPLLKDGKGEFDGKTYTKVAPSPDAIGGTRGRQKKEVDQPETATESEADYA